jgi:hypothetical protein
MYFCYSPNGFGVEFFDTKEEAQSRAEWNFEQERIYAGDGWDENVDEICWGKVIQKVERTSCKEAPPDSDFDEIWEYDLLPVIDDQDETQ